MTISFWAAVVWGSVPDSPSVQAQVLRPLYGPRDGRQREQSRRWNGIRTGFLLLATAILATAQTFTTLATFNGTNGVEPSGALIQGTDGNFYGTTAIGGVHNGGTVFKITPGGTLTTLYSFCSLTSCADGSGPQAGLIQASDGNFYGTTDRGGANGYGTVFKFTPGGTETTLYSFCSNGPFPNCADGAYPTAGLIQASDGNFYGTTNGLGSESALLATVFKITPGGALTTLTSFNVANGADPRAALIQASDGNLYGTTAVGGGHSLGTIFKITPGGTLTTLYSFCRNGSYPNCADGAEPAAGLIQASDGNFYGTTAVGGVNSNAGTVYKITPGGTLTTLYSFCAQAGCVDGSTPGAGLSQASDGNFYGTTTGQGSGSSGTVFKITPGGILTTLNNFDGTDGSDPAAGLIQGADGNIYGTTVLGGPSSDGTVFKLVLASATAAPAINQSSGVINGASFLPGIAPSSWITIKGTNLSPVTDTWANSVVNGNLPTTLDGVSVSVGGEPAYVYYVSPTQINALAPSSFGSGAVTVTNSGETSTAVTAAAASLAPAFFLWPGNYAVATRQDYSLAVKNGTFSTTTTPAAPGDVIILWGSGFGPTSPAAPVGVATPSTTTYNTANKVTVTVGGAPVTVYGAALAAGDAGLYQVAIQIPTSLASGDYAVVATVGTAQSPSTTLITVQN
jgi:uncharacterized protein (TIGR03437 family)